MCPLDLCLYETRWKFPDSSLFCLGFHPISESGTSWVKITREASVSYVQFQNSRREFTGLAYFIHPLALSMTQGFVRVMWKGPETYPWNEGKLLRKGKGAA